MFKDFPELHRVKPKQEIANFFCIQQWDGKELKCVCPELEVSPSELMLR